MKEKDLKWCTAQLQTLTHQEEMSGELALLVAGMTSRKEITEFLADLLGPDSVSSRHVQGFVNACLERFGAQDHELAYRKEKVKKQPKKKTVVKTAKDKSPFEDIFEIEEPSVPMKKGSSKKTHYVKIISDGALSSIMLPGRNVCNCLAQRHTLINNCMGCGRIVCVQEGEGPCMFCGRLVATPDNTARIATQSKKGREVERKLMDNKPAGFTPISHHAVEHHTSLENEALNKAVRHKQKLLEYDRLNIHRSKVLDDESDYFQNTRWLSKGEKKVVEAKAEERSDALHASRLNTKVTFDFAGRKIVQDADPFHTEMGVVYEKGQQERGTETPSRGVDSEFEPVFIESSKKRSDPPPQHIQTHKSVLNSKRSGIRNQDGEMKLLRDEGMCLTMHQPWASWLVHGIKKLEGRSWYSAHRGPLWIHAASKQSSAGELAELEEGWRRRCGREVAFPAHYPTSVIVGSVQVQDVLPRFPNGEENDSEYLFVCTDPAVLPVPISARGSNKIWRLSKQDHAVVTNQI